MNSSDYWAEREAEALKNYIRDEQEYDRQIKTIYASMLDNCQKEIDAFYNRYASAEGISIAEAKRRVSKADIAAYERKAAKYGKDKDFSKQANEEMRLYNATMRINRLEMLKANIGLELIAGHDELEKFMGDILQGRTIEELERQAGILGKTIRNNAEKANAIVNASFHNATFSDRIWEYQDLLRQDVGKLLQSGLIAGKNPRVLARAIKNVFGQSTYNCERLMRTEMARVQTEAQRQSFVRNGFEQYEFIANSDRCDICADLDGKHFDVEDMMPGENAPPMHPNCRCSVAAWEDSEEYNQWLEYISLGGNTESWEKLKERTDEIIKYPQKALEKSENSGIIKLDNKIVRDWYVKSVSRIKDYIGKNLTQEERARKAFNSRNRIRILAREMMEDETIKIRLYTERANKTFDELVESKMKRKNMTREQAIIDIFDTATKTNDAVNREFGIGGE